MIYELFLYGIIAFTLGLFIGVMLGKWAYKPFKEFYEDWERRYGKAWEDYFNGTRDGDF